MTAREIKLARSVFHDAIDYEKVRIHKRKWSEPTDTGEHRLFCDDFCDRDLGLQGLFIHELVHVWQHQQGIFLPLKRHPFSNYNYALKPGWMLERYGIEQQAEIVRHYFLLKNKAKVPGAPPLEQYEGVLPFAKQATAK